MFYDINCFIIQIQKESKAKYNFYPVTHTGTAAAGGDFN